MENWYVTKVCNRKVYHGLEMLFLLFNWVLNITGPSWDFPLFSCYIQKKHVTSTKTDKILKSDRKLYYILLRALWAVLNRHQRGKHIKFFFISFPLHPYLYFNFPHLPSESSPSPTLVSSLIVYINLYFSLPTFLLSLSLSTPKGPFICFLLCSPGFILLQSQITLIISPLEFYVCTCHLQSHHASRSTQQTSVSHATQSFFRRQGERDSKHLAFKVSLILYLFIWEKEQEQGGGAEGEGEADSPLSKGPNVGLSPRTLRSRPEPKADA